MLPPLPCPPSPTPPRPLRSPTGSGRAYSAEIVAGVRALVEGAGLPYREAAARSGLRADTVGRWARRFGWRRAGAGARAAAWDPQGRHAEERPKAASRSTHNRGASFETPAARAPQDDERWRVRPSSEEKRRPYRYGPALQEAARVRVEGTRIGMERIALELGVARPTLYRWQKRFRWRRPGPPEPPVRPDKSGRSGAAGPAFFRSRRFGRPYGGDAVGTARDLVTGSNLTSGRIAARAGISRSTLWRWTKRGGWTRPVATGRSHPPYGPEVVAAARELYEATELSAAMIAARVNATPDRVKIWARTKGWTRPRNMSDPYGRQRRRRRTDVNLRRYRSPAAEGNEQLRR